MSNQSIPDIVPNLPLVYQVRLEGHLRWQWTEWFGGLTLTLADNGDTLLTCVVADQAALHGVLKRVRDLGIPLISVVRVAPGHGAGQQSSDELQ